nr:MAG TPA: hypothetical protein [Caudoviricetes sp.]
MVSSQYSKNECVQNLHWERWFDSSSSDCLTRLSPPVPPVVF